MALYFDVCLHDHKWFWHTVLVTKIGYQHFFRDGSDAVAIAVLAVACVLGMGVIGSV